MDAQLFKGNLVQSTKRQHTLYLSIGHGTKTTELQESILTKSRQQNSNVKKNRKNAMFNKHSALSLENVPAPAGVHHKIIWRSLQQALNDFCEKRKQLNNTLILPSLKEFLFRKKVEKS